MEQLNSHFDNSTVHSSTGACRARVSNQCLDRGGKLEPGRRGNTRYCHDCAPIVRREQSKRGKQRLLLNPVWLKNQREYRKKHREDHRDYMRYWRGLRSKLSQVSANEFGALLR